ncbi:TonB-dependent receptor plug domain-containing protein [candidate division KSB1 bacterium]|nr:TonB-dependent receptor plug domain-containing protein [candidate division KSB1 bacterium]
MKTNRTQSQISVLVLWLFIFLIIINLSNVLAKNVTGEQSGKWDLNNSPYIIKGDIIVPENQVLTIEPGVIIKFSGYYRITVKGTIFARGTESNQIVFTSEKDFEFGNIDSDAQHTSSPGLKDWDVIEFTNDTEQQRSELFECMIRYSANVLQLRNASPFLKKVTIIDCNSYQIYVNGALQTITPGLADYISTSKSNISVPTTSSQQNDKQDDIFGTKEFTFGEMKVISVSKKEESLMDVASSIYVISNEDIQRSGATRLQDILKLAPGVWFEDMNYYRSPNTVRGHLSFYSQTVLVLLDGVPVTSSLVTGGMRYDALNIPPEQIDHIEVIKGPGGTIYGANAVSGIISIFTKEPENTESSLLTLNGGLQDYISPNLNYYHKFSDRVSATLFANYKTTRGYDQTDLLADNMIQAPRAGLPDTMITNKYPADEVNGLDTYTFGMNLQTKFTDKSTGGLRIFYNNLQHKSYTTTIAKATPFLLDLGHRNLIMSGRFDQAFSANHNAFFHAKYRNDHYEEILSGGYTGNTQVMDFEFQDNIVFGFNNLSFGGNYRLINYHIALTPGADHFFLKSDNTEYLYAGFVQNKIDIGKNVDLTLGIKAETWTLISNSPEFSPSARIAIKPKENLVFWGAFSRAVTTPSYVQTMSELHSASLPITTPEQAEAIADAQGLTGAARQQFLGEMAYMRSKILPGTNKLIIASVTSPDLKPTNYLTYELGIRTNLSPRLYFDFSTFYTAYDNRIDSEADLMNNAPVYSAIDHNITLWPIYYTNMYQGNFFGGEFVCKYLPSRNIRIELSYCLFKDNDEKGLTIPHSVTGETFPVPKRENPLTPEHLIRIRPYIDFPAHATCFTLNAAWSSKHSIGEKYNYVTQNWDLQNGIYVDPPKNWLQLDFNIEKRFMNGKLAVNLWGRDILSGDRVAHYASFSGVAYPNTIHRTFGGGLNCNF